MRFVGLALHEPVPDAKTVWLYRDQLVRAGAFDRLFARPFDKVLRSPISLTTSPAWPGLRSKPRRRNRSATIARCHCSATNENRNCRSHRLLSPPSAPNRSKTGYFEVPNRLANSRNRGELVGLELMAPSICGRDFRNEISLRDCAFLYIGHFFILPYYLYCDGRLTLFFDLSLAVQSVYRPRFIAPLGDDAPQCAVSCGGAEPDTKFCAVSRLTYNIYDVNWCLLRWWGYGKGYDRGSEILPQRGCPTLPAGPRVLL
jgi:hypothetical protein